eukprot:9777778-Alexandrium_andersonii.AAC.1
MVAQSWRVAGCACGHVRLSAREACGDAPGGSALPHKQAATAAHVGCHGTVRLYQRVLLRAAQRPHSSHLHACQGRRQTVAC